MARQYVGSYGLGRWPIFIHGVDFSKDSVFPSELESEVSELLREQYARVLDLFRKEKDRLVTFAREVALHKQVMIDKSDKPNAS
jgi:cell division protease FtsH